MNLIYVYHTKPLARGYRSDWTPDDEWTPDDCAFAYSYPSPNGVGDLENVFRENNAVDGSEVNVRLGFRSLSVGDYIMFDHTGDTMFRVNPFGFTELK